ncbi:MAG TPA: 30S ribosome-binding factor RbfA [Thermoanaerobaculia bacterium]|nr:30S ribosome-binding factor RbfA [Thermoanaerobaculia bacterium]
MPASRRPQRVALLVREELSRLVLMVAHDPDLRRVTITDVEMPGDLRSARIYFSCLGTEAERELAKAALNRAAGYLRREVTQRCGLRYAPELTFRFDETLERGARIEELLAKVKSAPAETEPEPEDDES